MICSLLGLKSGFSVLNVLFTVQIIFALAISSADSVLDWKNGERDSSAQSVSSVMPTCIPRVLSAAIVQTVSMRRLLAYGSAAGALDPNLSILTSPQLKGPAGPSVHIWKCGLEQPQSMLVVQYRPRASFCLSQMRREGSTCVVESHTLSDGGVPSDCEICVVESHILGDSGVPSDRETCVGESHILSDDGEVSACGQYVVKSHTLGADRVSFDCGVKYWHSLEVAVDGLEVDISQVS